MILAFLGPSGSSWLPVSASTMTEPVDDLFQGILWISTFFFVGILLTMALFIFKYRAGEGREAERTATHSLPLELTWSIIPLLIVIGIFYVGFTGFMEMVNPPTDSFQVLVTAQKWKWSFTYPSGYVSEDLHVPLGKPVSLVMSSEDVIHSLFIPAFRIKQDVVTGRYTKVWFQATKAGKYDLFCTEYCGTNHSGMRAKVIVEPFTAFDAWLEEAALAEGKGSPVDYGRLLVEKKGCVQCHTTDGTPKLAPTFKGLFGHEVVLQGGEKVLVDENYVRQSMLDPASQVVAGFNPIMPPYQGRLKEKEVTALIEFIKSLSASKSQERLIDEHSTGVVGSRD